MSIIISSPSRGQEVRIPIVMNDRIRNELAGRIADPLEADEIPLSVAAETELDQRMRRLGRTHTLRQKFTWTRSGIAVDESPRYHYDAATGKTYIGYAVL